MGQFPITYVGGSKGGVGKSKLCFAIIEYLVSKKKPVLIIESDTSNPDVFKTHSPYVECGIICKEVDLDSANGWIELVNLADEYKDHYVVINSAARSNAGISNYSATLKNTLPELNRELVVFWMINRQRDSIELLRIFMNYFQKTKINVCRNIFFGDSEKFELYNNSIARKMIEEDGGLTLNFPELADRVADKLYSDRVPIFKGAKDFQIGDRAELKRWINEYHIMFDKSDFLKVKNNVA